MKEDLKQKYQLPEVASFKPSNLSPCSKWHPPPPAKKKKHMQHLANHKGQKWEWALHLLKQVPLHRKRCTESNVNGHWAVNSWGAILVAIYYVSQGNPQMEVSWNGSTPKSSILIICSIINHPFWVPLVFLNEKTALGGLLPIPLQMWNK